MAEGTVPAAGLPRPDGSQAVLIGVSRYEKMEQLPAVEKNLATLEQAFTDEELWGLPPRNCTTLLNPTSVDQVLDAVHSAAIAASEALVVYFAGHGLLDERSDLYLALADSDKGRIYRAVRYDDIRREVVGTARRCYGKVVILDCCYSGRALQGGMSGPIEMADHARVDGTYLMTAAAETSLALSPPGELYTAFTGALIDKLLNGLPDGPDLLDMETLFYHVRADMQARNFPIPQQRTRNDGKAIALARNRRGTRRRIVGSPIVTRELPQPPRGFEAAMRYPPGKLAGQLQALRDKGHDAIANQLLAASAAARPGQEVAAIVDLFTNLSQLSNVQTVIQAAASREPVDALEVIDALHEIDLPEHAAGLLAEIAGRSVEDAASLGQLLRNRNRTAELTFLLDAA